MVTNLDPVKADKQVKKLGWKKYIFFNLFLTLLVSITGGYVGSRFYISNNIKTIVQTYINVPEGTIDVKSNSSRELEIPIIKKSEPGLVKGLSSSFIEEEWEIDSKRIKKIEDKKSDLDGFYCVKESRNWDSAEIWYKTDIIVGSSMSVRYLVANGKEELNRLPMLIFVFGEKRTFRMFFPKDVNLIGFESNIDENTNFQQKSIPRQVDLTKEVDLKLSIQNPSSNQASFSYTMKYIPKVNDEGDMSQQVVESTFSSEFPWPNPGDTSAGQKIGFGAFNESCFKLLDFQLQ